MSPTSWSLAWAVLCVACGNHGSKPKGQEAGSAGSAAPVAWQFDQFVEAPHHRVVVLKAGNDAALVDASGKATSPVKVGPDEVAALGNGTTVVLAGSGVAHVLDRDGREIAAVPTSGAQGTAGSTSFALAGDKGTGIYAFTTGKPVVENKLPAQRVVYHRPDGYLFADAAQLWFVDEVNGKERWRVTVANLADAAYNVRPGSLFVMHPDRTFEELEYTAGKVVAKGTCEGKPPGETDHKRPSACAGYPKVDLSKEDAREPVRDPSGRGDYYPMTKQSKESFVVARDPVGRIRWSTAAPIDLDTFRGPFTAGDAGVVAFLSGKGAGSRILAFDDASGKLLFQRDLDGERLVGVTGPCWLVVSAKHAACLDAHSGTPTWDVVASGEAVDAWTLSDGEALLADANPLTLSRIGKDGHRSWQVELPETHLEHASAPGKQGSLWVESKAWQLSDAVGIVEMKDGLTVIDLATGKLAKVH